jgi:Pyrimidine dimer DNA glycosylase
MRLWSLHPSYLDAKGLVALWREGLLARKVLQGKTHGYRHHPQLIRFQAQKDPLAAIEAYLWSVYEESLRRGFQFDVGKLSKKRRVHKIQVTAGQLGYELKHLGKKLKVRDAEGYRKIALVHDTLAHPLFLVTPGEVEEWERV